MKRKFTSLLVAATFIPLSAQIFSSGFENNNGTPLTQYSKINADGLTVPFYAPILDFDTEAWIQYYDGYDNKIAMSSSWYDPAGQAEDWLITPKISLPTNGTPTLYWKAKSYDFEKTDSYKVLVSTTDNQPASFTTLLDVSNEQPYEFNSRTLDLSQFKGQNIYIAFLNNTNDGLYLALDDLYISNSSNCKMPGLEGATVVDLSEKGFTVSWPENDGILQYDTGLTDFYSPVASTGIQTALAKSYTGLQPKTRYQYFLKNADCGSGWSTPKSIWTAALPPYSYDFEYTAENYGEYDSDGWTSTTWVNGTGAAAQSGNGYVYNNTSKSFAKNDWIYSYPLKLNAGESVSIKLFAQMGNANATPATLKISAAKSPDKSSNFLELSSNTITGGPYNEFTTTFTPTETGVYYIGFGNVTPVVTNNAALRIDNVRITKENLAVADTKKSKILIYPNPVVDRLQIKSNEAIVKTEIYNSEGKIIATGSRDSVDFSNFPKGLYLVKIFTKTEVITEKVIK